MLPLLIRLLCPPSNTAGCSKSPPDQMSLSLCLEWSRACQNILIKSTIIDADLTKLMNTAVIHVSSHFVALVSNKFRGITYGTSFQIREYRAQSNYKIIANQFFLRITLPSCHIVQSGSTAWFTHFCTCYPATPQGSSLLREPYIENILKIHSYMYFVRSMHIVSCMINLWTLTSLKNTEKGPSKQKITLAASKPSSMLPKSGEIHQHFNTKFPRDHKKKNETSHSKSSISKQEYIKVSATIYYGIALFVINSMVQILTTNWPCTWILLWQSTQFNKAIYNAE